MSYQAWSWLLTVVGVTGFILAGKKVWWCWYINIGCQGLWVTYAIVSHQYGFIVASAVYTVVFTQNAVVWTREHRERKSVEHSARHRRNVEKLRETGRRLAGERENLVIQGVDM